MEDLQNAVMLLHEKGYTCVWCKDGMAGATDLRGVKPLVMWLKEKAVPDGACAADKVVGKATAFLYCLLGVRAVYADVISESALNVLRSKGILAEYGSLAPFIVNRQGDGVCPFEAAVADVSDPEEAYGAILEKMDAMGIPH